MSEELKKKEPALINRRGAILLHDNARPHTAAETKQTIKELKIETLLHLSYSPDLSPSDFHLFKHLDSYLRGKIFGQEFDVKKEFENFINSKEPSFFQKALKNSSLVGRDV